MSTYVNVTTDLGANNLDSTGATDCTTKFNAAMTAMGAQAYYFPKGTYKFTTPANACPAGTMLIGDGKALTTINCTRASRLTDDGITLSNNCVLRDIYFTTNDDANAVYYVVKLNFATGVLIDGCKFSNGYTGCLRGHGTCQAIVTDCEFTNCYQEASAAMVTGCFQRSTFSGCWFHNNGGTLTTNHCYYTANYSTTAATAPRDNTITGCVFQDWTGGSALVPAKGEPDYSYNIAVVGNVFANSLSNGAGACQPTTCSGFTFSDNAIFGANYVLSMFGVSDFVIANNTVTLNTLTTGNVAFGMQSGSGSGVISGNSIRGGLPGVWNFGQAIALYGAHDVLVEGNVIAGWMLGVGCYPVGTTGTDITIKHNRFVIDPAWTLGPTGGYYFGNAATSYAVACDGASTRLKVVDNECSGLNYELFFTKFTYAGDVNRVKFQSGSWDAPTTAVLGYSGGAVPTNVVQLTQGSVPVSTAGIQNTFSTIAR